MNFRFWKKKPVAEKEGEEARKKTVVADEADPKPAKPGWFARLKSTLKPSRKKSDPDNNTNEPETQAEHADGDHGGHKEHKPLRSDKAIDTEGEESKPAKANFLVRLKNVLHLSRKRNEPDEEGLPEHPAKHTGKKTPEPPHKKIGTSAGGKSGALEEESEQPARKHGKKKWAILALLILLIGGGFGVWKWLQPPPDHKAPPLTAQKQEKPGETPAPEPTDAAVLTEAAEKAQTEATALAEAAAKAQAEATAQAEAAAQAKAETEAAAQAKAADQAVTESPTAASPPASADTDVQAQLDALRKQNQEMQTQLEALKNQRSSATRPAGAATSPPKGGVLIINGKNTKESAQGLKQVIEEMNAASGIKGEQKPSK